MEHEILLPSREVTLPASWQRLPVAAGAVGAGALAASFALGWGKEQLGFSYLAGFFYWLTVALGGLFFVLLHYLARSGWSVVVRRLAEHVMATLPLFAVLFLPVVFSMHDLFHWTHQDAVAHDPLLQHKEVYLNEGFFYLRAAIYFIVWSGLAFYFWRQSTRQDSEGGGRSPAGCRLSRLPAWCSSASRPPSPPSTG